MEILKNLRVFIGIMMFVFAVSLSVGSIKSVQGQDVDALKVEIDNEKVKRANSVNSVQGGLAQEVLNREAGDANLQQQITNIH